MLFFHHFIYHICNDCQPTEVKLMRYTVLGTKKLPHMYLWTRYCAKQNKTKSCLAHDQFKGIPRLKCLKTVDKSLLKYLLSAPPP